MWVSCKVTVVLAEERSQMNLIRLSSTYLKSSFKTHKIACSYKLFPWEVCATLLKASKMTPSCFKMYFAKYLLWPQNLWKLGFVSGSHWLLRNWFDQPVLASFAITGCSRSVQADLILFLHQPLFLNIHLCSMYRSSQWSINTSEVPQSSQVYIRWLPQL